MLKNSTRTERGQVLILLALAATGLFAFAALAIDGSMAFSDKRHAQNAADTAVLNAALAYARDNDVAAAALTRATSNGYDGGAMSDVIVKVVDSPSSVCPASAGGKDITVDIVSTVNTAFARVIGISQVTNAVTATSRVCGSFTGPPFYGNAIVSLAPSGLGFDARGTPDFDITGGGIFANSSSHPAVTCGGKASVTAPSVTSVGSTGLGNCYNGPTPVTGVTQLTSTDYVAFFPRQPACNGTASISGNHYSPESGADGSKVELPISHGDYTFAPGLYCVTNISVNSHSSISGSEVTFYVSSANFSLLFNGGGNLTASAPTSGEYKGILMYLAPQFDANGNLLNTQSIDMRGNGNGNLVGTFLAPSADVTMFGNSGTGAFNSQIIAYQVDSGGTADIKIVYQAKDNFQVIQPITLTLLQ